MVSHRQTEGGLTPDERAPLLAHEAVQDDTGVPRREDESILEPEKAASRKWQYAWRGFWTVLAILVTAVFVKGWIDADDVNVSVPRLVNVLVQN